MKVIELIKLCSLDTVCQNWDTIYKNINDYHEYPSTHIPEFVKEYLLKIEPVETDFHIVIEEQNPYEDEDPYISIYGVKEVSDETWAMELSTNAEWLGFEIEDNIPYPHTDEELLCHILWEMSFMGWYDNDRLEVKEDLNNRSAEVDKWIEEGTLEEHCISTEELMEKFK